MMTAGRKNPRIKWLLLLIPVCLAAIWLAVRPGAEAGTALANAFFAVPGQETTAENVLVIDRDSGRALYEKNATERLYPASTTKLMTALCAVEAVRDLDKTTVTVRQEVLDQLAGSNSSMAGLVAGEELTMEQLLYSLMLPSGNDAALVIADYVGGGESGFVQLMNRKAAALGCMDTYFVNSHGLAGREQYSTAWDLARIAEAYLQVPDLAKIAGTREYSFTSNMRGKVTMENSNRLLDPESELYEPSATGVKTGTTSLGASFISAGERDGLRVLCVTAGVPATTADGYLISPNPALAEGRKFLSWACGQFEKVTLYKGGKIPVTVEGKKRYAVTVPDGPVTAVVPRELAGELTEQVTVTEDLSGPLSAGTAVGAVTWCWNGTPVGEGLPLLLAGGLPPAPVWLWPTMGAVLAALLALLAAALKRRRVRERTDPWADGPEWIKEEPPEDPDWYA